MSFEIAPNVQQSPASTMKAVVLEAANQLRIAEVPVPQPGPGEVVVRLRAAALNHREVWIKQGQYAGLRFPITPGSDGAGVVARVGAGVAPEWTGREVIINPSFGWGDNPRAQGSQFTILGLPRDGTFAEEIRVPVDNLAAKPAHLDWEHAAALPLAGLTAFRALFSRAQLQPGEKVLLTGIGGGVALFALQFALGRGARVWVTSSSPEKIDRARQMGASGGADYRVADWAKPLDAEAGGFDVIVDSAGGPGFLQLVDLAVPGGRIVFFGATRDNPPGMPQRKIFWRQLSLLGTSMGSPQDFRSMLESVESQRLLPVVSAAFPLEQAADAFAVMEQGAQFGKIVLRC